MSFNEYHRVSFQQAFKPNIPLNALKGAFSNTFVSPSATYLVVNIYFN
jgi:hypothetical protein